MGTKSEIDHIRARLAASYYDDPEVASTLRTLLTALDEARALVPNAKVRAQIRSLAAPTTGTLHPATSAVLSYVDRVEAAVLASTESVSRGDFPW